MEGDGVISWCDPSLYRTFYKQRESERRRWYKANWLRFSTYGRTWGTARWNNFQFERSCIDKKPMSYGAWVLSELTKRVERVLLRRRAFQAWYRGGHNRSSPLTLELWFLDDPLPYFQNGVLKQHPRRRPICTYFPTGRANGTF